MHKTFPRFKVQGEMRGGFSAHLIAPHRRWYDVVFAVRPLVWQAILAAVLTAGLLLAFHQVVQGAVLQGEVRRQAFATHTMETSRCNTLGEAGATSSCLLELKASAAPRAIRLVEPELIAMKY